MPTAFSQPRLTRVNGIGLWNSWTRNFKTPLLALLDLIDNSVDAAFDKVQSESVGSRPGPSEDVESTVISPDLSSSSSRPQFARQFHGKMHIDADTWDGRTTGIKIVNNCRTSMKDLAKIMEVYSSSKGRAEHGADHSPDEALAFAESIGENGVGLKQGCATLTDMSFVFTRASDGKMGMAVIAHRLQSPAGVYLPHIYFESTETQALRTEMQNKFSSQPLISVGDCVARYGDGSLEDGINRVLRHLAHLNKKGSGGWGEESNVFCVVLHQLKHGQRIASGSRYDETEEEVIPTVEQQHSDNACYLMQQLKNELPRNYIHINIEVRVGGEDIQFFYWQRRLAELTKFCVEIDQDHSYLEAADWYRPANGYPLRIFCGFDSVRLSGDRRGTTSCSLHIYSRFSGRLIKGEEDARALLKLPAGGTDYSQGLTIIVDDMLGNLPLNPTKQDVAFGEQAHGDIHKRNIFAWLSAVVRLYYKHHLEKNCNGRKTELTRKVKQFGTPIIDPSRLKILDDSIFTEFVDPNFMQNYRGTISCSNRNSSMEVRPGLDTLRRFTVDQRNDGPRVAGRVVGIGVGGPGTSGVWPHVGIAGLHTGTDGLVSRGVGVSTGSVGLSTSPRWAATQSVGLRTARVQAGMSSAEIGTDGFQPGTSNLRFRRGIGLDIGGVRPAVGGGRLGTGTVALGTSGASPGMHSVGYGADRVTSRMDPMRQGAGNVGLNAGGAGLGRDTSGLGLSASEDGARPESSSVGTGCSRSSTRDMGLADAGAGIVAGAAGLWTAGEERQSNGSIGMGNGAVGLVTGTARLSTCGEIRDSAQKSAQKRKEAPHQWSRLDPDHTLSLSTTRQRVEANGNENNTLKKESDIVVVDEALPVIDLGTPDTTESDAHEASISPKSHDQCKSPQGQNVVKQETRSAGEKLKILQAHVEDLQGQIVALRNAVKNHKGKSHERKTLVRQIDGVNKQLKKKVAALESQLLTACDPKTKSTRELQLEERVDQLANALERKQEESADVIKTLTEQVASMKKENCELRRAFGAQQGTWEDLTTKLEESHTQDNQ
eukprot:CAMPEP_0113588842 /NCGR_PEP_ID=MMETSP0015_2-20120614/35749_1 /TAXON_ID=2838 /ORGANISM="Odontella" /LENGTH=1052 /DNA_ID=CAMNT_0000494779 /DNA_START=292 /DNA_END=3450 /DNA_ORIENTATION=- /assembly_acc=CAM_ASM_000160